MYHLSVELSLNNEDEYKNFNVRERDLKRECVGESGSRSKNEKEDARMEIRGN
jgi:hypothetical protein